MINLINDDVLKAKIDSKLPPVNLVVTSPPYNVGIEYDKHKDTMTYEEYLEWSEKWIKKCFDLMADDGRLCINIPFSITPTFVDAKSAKKNGVWDVNYPAAADFTGICQKVGFKFWRTVVWDKNISNKTCWGSWRSASAPFMRDPSESIIIFYKKQWKRLAKGESTIEGQEFMDWTKNVWKMHPETKSAHPAAFPAELPNRCIKLFSYKGDLVFDPFTGSGTTGESAVRLGRNFLGVEMSEAYFKMAKERIEAAELQASLTTTFTPSAAVGTKEVAEAW